MWFDRSIAIFAKSGDTDKDASEAHATGLTHKGEVGNWAARMKRARCSRRRGRLSRRTTSWRKR